MTDPQKETGNGANGNGFTGPLTLRQMHENAASRISLIVKEFMTGFDFLASYPRSVTFFGSSELPQDNPYCIKARGLAKRIVSELGYSVFTGGGPGIMEAASHGAHEAGGPSLGLTIKLPRIQVTNQYLTDQLDFHYFFSRKVCLSFSAEAYVFFPGGFGTLDEVFEILTLIQTEKIAPVPVILVGADFWGKLDDFIKSEILSRSMVEKEDMGLYTITDDENKILEIINLSPIREGVPYSSKQA